MVKIGKAEEVNFARGLIFGPPRQGKTTLLGTLDDDERTAPALILDFEGGSNSLVGHTVDVARIRDWQDFEEAHDVLEDPDTEYRSYGVDSLSEAQIGGMLRILDKPGRGRADPDQMAQPDWGLILIQMRRFIRGFVDLPMHGFMTALSKEDLDRKEGRLVVPAFQGAFQHEVAGAFDIVAYLGRDEETDERLLLLNNYPGYRIGTRSPWGVPPPDDIVDPTASKLLDALGLGVKKKARKASGGK